MAEKLKLVGQYHMMEDCLKSSEIPLRCFFDPVPIICTYGSLLRKDRPKIQHFIKQVVTNWSDNEFQRHFRISRTVFKHVLDELRVPLTKVYHGGWLPVPPDQQLYIFVWYLSNQDSQREIALIFGVSEWLVHTCIRQVSGLLSSIRSHYIAWPTEDRQHAIAQRFEESYNFPGIVGALDGTHIPIVNCPDGQNDYINRKGFASVQLQLVVDDQLLINDAYVGWPGSTHDARVLRNSYLFVKAENGEKVINNHYIIGDGAYPLKSWLLTPFRDNGHLSPSQKRYNKMFSSARQCVERANAHLKGRFRRLQKVYCADVAQICHLVMAACILHNLCIICDDSIDDFIDMAQAQDINNYPNIFPSAQNAVATRDRLVARFV